MFNFVNFAVTAFETDNISKIITKINFLSSPPLSLSLRLSVCLCARWKLYEASGNAADRPTKHRKDALVYYLLSI